MAPAGWLADAGYGQNADFRAALAEREIPYVVGIRGDLTVQPHDAHPAAPAFSGTGRPPVPR
ncbi:transposase [Streptomyces sp. TRM68367]|nr:transposase [Streptomyces sp. TRM68367]